MNKIVMFACLILLTGCGNKYPLTTEIRLHIPPQAAAIYADSHVSVTGKDLRKLPEVIFYNLKKKPAVKVSSFNSPLEVITASLTDGLRDQGLLFDVNSPVNLLLEINQLQVSVTRPKTLYQFEAVSQMTLKVTNGTKSLSKKYSRQEDRKSVFLPKTAELEHMVNSQLSAIINEILNDTVIRELIKTQ